MRGIDARRALMLTRASFASGHRNEERSKGTRVPVLRCRPHTLHVQDDAIVKVTSPDDHDVTRGNLCVKGRFGYQYVQNK
jgi:predicted molibdopterin-dependent oxidoreductase YjgC